MSNAHQADQLQVQYQNYLAKHHSKLNLIYLPKFQKNQKNKLEFSHQQESTLNQIF